MDGVGPFGFEQYIPMSNTFIHTNAMETSDTIRAQIPTRDRLDPTTTLCSDPSVLGRIHSPHIAKPYVLRILWVG